jgi:hypothetical protein
MKKYWISLAILVFLVLINVGGAQAVTYRFQVTKEDVNVFINQDGTASIEYWITFANDASADPIDYVDVGMPNSSYVLSSITADVAGAAIHDIQPSQYVNPGAALGLGSNAIQPGQSGEVHVRIGKVSDLLHPGTQKEAEPYASFQFQPNYFGSEYVHDNTDLTVTLILPPGLKETEPRYLPPKNWPGQQAPLSGVDNQNRVYYKWNSNQATGSGKYTFGATFPSRMVPSSAIVAAPAASITFNNDNLCCAGFFLVFGGIFGLALYSSIWGARKRKLQYLPPRIAIEGHGIKRGLTSVEAAVLMETPIDRVMTMTLFSVIKKGAATVIARDPLKIELHKPLPETLQPYEKDFLAAFEPDLKSAAQRKALQDMTVNLIKSVTEKMKGFSRKETTAYYEDIMKRAWDQVAAGDTPEVKMEKFDEYIGWTMLDKKYDDRTRETFGGGGPVFVPIWWGNYDPVYRPHMSNASIPTSVGGGSGKTTIQLPNLPGSDFAASMVNGVQSWSAGTILGGLTEFTGGVTNRTNPVPVTPSTGGYRGGGGGGHSCACACACAGCACACAGGGR